MKIDHEYLKGLLEAFEKAEGPFTDINELEENGYSYKTNEFLFHMDILWDKNFVASEARRLGYRADAKGQRGVWSDAPLRLTAEGHEFLAAIKPPEVWAKLKTNFKDAGISGVKTAAKVLFQALVKAQARELI